MHLEANAEVAIAAGVNHTGISKDGTIMKLDSDGVHVIGKVPTEISVFDGFRIKRLLREELVSKITCPIKKTQDSLIHVTNHM